MGTKFNIFMADTFDAQINSASKGELFGKVLAKAANYYRSKDRELFGKEGNLSDYDEESETGDIASGQLALIFATDKYGVSEDQMRLLEKGNSNSDFPIEADWFSSIKMNLRGSTKWDPSICVKINGRWAIMGYYAS